MINDPREFYPEEDSILRIHAWILHEHRSVSMYKYVYLFIYLFMGIPLQEMRASTSIISLVDVVAFLRSSSFFLPAEICLTITRAADLVDSLTRLLRFTLQLITTSCWEARGWLGDEIVERDFDLLNARIVRKFIEREILWLNSQPFIRRSQFSVLFYLRNS